MHTDVLIVGGGLAGIACALALLDGPLQVLLVEGGAALGGRARSWRDSATKDLVDVGPHVVTSEYHNFLALLDSLGTREQIHWQRDPLPTLLTAGKITDLHLHALPAPLSLLPTMLRVSEIGSRAKLSNARATLLAMRFDERDIDALDNIAGSELLRRLRVRPEFVDWFWRSLSMTILNVPLERCSAAALMRCYAQLVGHDRYEFGFPRGGLGELFAPAAAKRLVARNALRLNAPVRTLIDDDGRCSGAMLEDGTRIDARYVVCALPPAEGAAVQPPRWRNAPAFRAARSLAPSQYISVYLWFRERLTQRLFWTRTWSADTVNFDFYDLANIREFPDTRGSLIASNIIHSQRLPAMNDAQVVAHTLRELAEFAPAAATATLLHTRVHRIALAVPCPVPGSERRRPPSATPVPGLVLAGDWTRPGLPACMESAVRSGKLAAEQIGRLEGRTDSIALPPPATTGIAGVLRRLRSGRDVALPT